MIPVHRRKRDLAANAASEATESLPNAESCLANFVLPDQSLPRAGKAKEPAAAIATIPPTTRDSPDPPLPPPEEAASAIFNAHAPTTLHSPSPVPQISSTPRDLVLREEVRSSPSRHTTDQGESDGTNLSYSYALSSPASSCDVSANDQMSSAPANDSVVGASSPRLSDLSPSQPRGKEGALARPSFVLAPVPPQADEEAIRHVARLELTYSVEPGLQ
ncbi:hypothetical protein HPB50_004398 [Hyalomma asiaticum]|uniref:Uncharacterized protein n=1 Tax=Hyalomma asiaticum TaxID=266040 RepID=A0ACB7RQJ4_HYAAI|nr:hypothetical protein HPB50_004398 [Hyalomma asiaticum]